MAQFDSPRENSSFQEPDGYGTQPIRGSGIVAAFGPHASAEDAEWAVNSIASAVSRYPGRTFRVWLELAAPFGLPGDYGQFAQLATTGSLGAVFNPDKTIQGKHDPRAQRALSNLLESSDALRIQYERDFFSPHRSQVLRGGAPSKHSYVDFDQTIGHGLASLKQRGVDIEVQHEPTSLRLYLEFMKPDFLLTRASEAATAGDVNEALRRLQKSVLAMCKSMHSRDETLAAAIRSRLKVSPDEVQLIPRGADHAPTLSAKFKQFDMMLESEVMEDYVPYTPLDKLCAQALSLQLEGEKAFSQLSTPPTHRALFWINLVNSLSHDFRFPAQDALQMSLAVTEALSDDHINQWMDQILARYPNQRPENTFRTAQRLAQVGYPEIFERVKIFFR